MRLKNCVCKQEVSSTGAPQGTVLSPFLYTLLTSDLQQSESWRLQKYSDNSAADRFIKDEQEAEHRELVDSFNSWCGNNYLILNMNKTADDCRGNQNVSNTIFIVKSSWWSRIKTFIWTADWAGDMTMKSFTRRDRADCIPRNLGFSSVCSMMLYIFSKCVFHTICPLLQHQSEGLKEKLKQLIKNASSVL